jgi:hypothetical protein
MNQENEILNVRVKTRYGNTLRHFLEQGIPTKCYASDVTSIQKLMKLKVHDWIKKFYLEHPDLLEEYLVSGILHREFAVWRKKWDKLNKLHRYTGVK